MVALMSASPSTIAGSVVKCSARNLMGLRVSGCDYHGGVGGGGRFPSFLPKEVHQIKDPFARTLAQRIQRLPVQTKFAESCIMSSCVKPRVESETNPVRICFLAECYSLLGSLSSCLEWRGSYPLLEDAGLEVWAVDILGWGFSDLEILPSCSASSKRYHLYQLWRSHIKRPMILVGPSLGAAVAIDFAVNFPEAVEKLVLINASVYAEGTGLLANLPRQMAYGMVSLLKSIPLRMYANSLFFDGISLTTSLDWTNVGRLHCLLPWWEDATVNYMLSGGYNVIGQIKQVKQKALIIWGQRDHVISSEAALRLHNELPDSIIHHLPNTGHVPHVENPSSVANLIADFAQGE
ncbi:hypothetical protein RJ639_012955 [Escallonia herrerae]|uniref:AB hydrolase-1 domain-containing protein n=1 Tax=Escallonia herrerae TaxID=1293975 RepID=A0AA89ARF2_9ASTE|nr:hypothetical protein RJ639_012955 [Escallonia herrerae]